MRQPAATTIELGEGVVFFAAFEGDVLRMAREREVEQVSKVHRDRDWKPFPSSVWQAVPIERLLKTNDLIGFVWSDSTFFGASAPTVFVNPNPTLA